MQNACQELATDHREYLEDLWNESFSEMKMTDSDGVFDDEEKDEEGVVSRSTVDHEAMGCVYIDRDNEENSGYCEVTSGGMFSASLDQLDLTFSPEVDHVVVMHTHPPNLSSDKFSGGDIDAQAEMMELANEHDLSVSFGVLYNCEASETGKFGDDNEGELCMKIIEQEESGINAQEVWDQENIDSKMEIIEDYATVCEEEISVDFKYPV